MSNSSNMSNAASSLVYAASQQGMDARGMQFAGWGGEQVYTLSSGQALWLELFADDMLSCLLHANMRIAAFDLHTGEDAMPSLIDDGKLNRAAKVAVEDYDSRLIAARLRGVGLSHESLAFYECPNHLDKPIIWRSKKPLVLIAVLPETASALVTGVSEQHNCMLQVQRAAASGYRHLPAPLAKVRDEFTIPKGTARAYRLPKNAYVQIIDLEGRQCSDFLAFNARALDKGFEKHIDSTVSRSFTRGAYPQPGLLNKFYDCDIVPLLAMVQDTVGRHDTFALACTARGYEERGFPGHVNCSDNISGEVAPYGIGARRAWAAVNFFFNTWILPNDNQLRSDEAWSRPGDYVLMQALEELVCVSTACPDDIDPINGWNPTDIHVRIYEPSGGDSDSKTSIIKPAVAYRLTPNEQATMTTESPFHAKTSALTKQYAAYLDYWVPQHYEAHGAMDEYWACRERASMQDMSNLRIYDIAGTDALPFLQKVLTRDIARLSLHKGIYALACDDSGYVLDDGTLFNIGQDLYRWTGTNPDAILHFQQVAAANNYRVWIRNVSNSLCTLAVQGALSRDILSPLLFVQPTQPAFDTRPWFGGCVARLHNRTGATVYVTRSGYTGELGYEIFCDNRDAEAVWDAVAEAGQGRIVPMGAEALNMLRIEAGLMAMHNEWGDRIDAYEAGLGFAVNLDKGEFIGSDALRRNAQSPRQKLVGIVLDGNEVAQHGDIIYHHRQPIGIVTSSTFSPSLQKPIGFARVAIEHAALGESLTIGKLDGQSKRLTATITEFPFIDPQRQRPRA